MNRKRDDKEPLTGREKLRVVWTTALFAAIGAALGMIAYSNGWLG